MDDNHPPRPQVFSTCIRHRSHNFSGILLPRHRAQGAMDGFEDRAHYDWDGDAAEPPTATKVGKSRRRKGSLGDGKRRPKVMEEPSGKVKRQPPAGGAKQRTESPKGH